MDSPLSEEVRRTAGSPSEYLVVRSRCPALYMCTYSSNRWPRKATALTYGSRSARLAMGQWSNMARSCGDWGRWGKSSWMAGVVMQRQHTDDYVRHEVDEMQNHCIGESGGARDAIGRQSD